jgi:hypothetical protein
MPATTGDGSRNARRGTLAAVALCSGYKECSARLASLRALRAGKSRHAQTGRICEGSNDGEIYGQFRARLIRGCRNRRTCRRARRRAPGAPALPILAAALPRSAGGRLIIRIPARFRMALVARSSRSHRNSIFTRPRGETVARYSSLCTSPQSQQCSRSLRVA